MDGLDGIWWRKCGLGGWNSVREQFVLETIGNQQFSKLGWDLKAKSGEVDLIHHGDLANFPLRGSGIVGFLAGLQGLVPVEMAAGTFAHL